MRILITGSRDWDDETTVAMAILKALRVLTVPAAHVTVIHGDARGADSCADRVARRLGCQTEKYPADWSQGRAAGVLRNQEMVERGANLVLAFPLPASRGTWDCVRRAKKAGLPVWVIRQLSDLEKLALVAEDE